ncbi:MAG: hypothetical protein Kow00124_13130 [Anaerolineae bacterium]
MQPTAAIPAAITPAPLPTAPALRRLTEPGCCLDPFWSPDGAELRFIDRRAAGLPAAIYAVRLADGVTYRTDLPIGIYSPDGRYAAFLSEAGETTVRDALLGREWVIPNGGRRVFFSPDSRQVAWAEEERRSNFSVILSTVYVSNVDGSSPRPVITVYGGSFSGWLDEDHILLYGRTEEAGEARALFSLSLTDSTRVNLVEGARVYDVSIAPGGGWVQYTVVRETPDSGLNGQWVVRRDGLARHRLEMAGGVRWRDGSRLLVIPLVLNAPGHELWQFDAEAGQMARLLGPDEVLFRVGAGQWSVAPGGGQVVFRSAADGALWLLDLPPG